MYENYARGRYMKKFIKYFIVILIAIIAIFQMLAQKKNVEAVTIGDTAYLQRAENGFYSVQKWTGSEWTYIIHSITNYIDENGVKRVAYCVDPDLIGIGYISGEYEGYDVKLKEFLSDQRLWRIYTNGYPYKTPSELGVENEEDAYLATKQAAYCIIRSYSLEDIKKLYRAGEDPVKGENLEDIKRRGNKIVDAIYKLVDIGYNGKETMQYNNILSIEKVGELSKDSIYENYYSQNYKVNSTVEYSEYNIESISSFPEGSYITNTNGKKQTKFSQGELFKVMIPKEKILENVTGTINITGKCKNYPIYYAECVTGNYQNYILCCDTYSNDIKASVETKVNAYTSKLQIEKVDKDTKLPINGVKFSLKYENGENLGTFETDENGRIYVQNLKQGNIKIQELETNKNYVLNTNANIIKLEYNELKTVKLENELKKGSIKIIKVDSNNNEIRIPNVKFEIYNENKELVATLSTNKNGEAQIDKLPIYTKYTIKEVETAEEYELLEESITVQLNENEIQTLTFKNNKKVVKEEPEEQEEETIEELEEAEEIVEIEEVKEVETLPRTGEIDISNYLLTVSAVGSIINKKLLKKKN